MCSKGQHTHTDIQWQLDKVHNLIVTRLQVIYRNQQSAEISILSGQSQHTAIKLLHTTETHLTTSKPQYFTQIFLKHEVMFEVFNHSLLLIGKVKQNITTVMKR